MGLGFRVQGLGFRELQRPRFASHGGATHLAVFCRAAAQKLESRKGATATATATTTTALLQSLRLLRLLCCDTTTTTGGGNPTAASPLPPLLLTTVASAPALILLSLSCTVASANVK